MFVSDEKELGSALKSGEDTIEIEGDLKNKVLRIKSTGKVAWFIAIGSISIAVAVIISSGGLGAPISAIIGTSGAVSVLGIQATSAAVVIAVTAGGVGALNSLRKYKIYKQTDNRMILKKK